MNTVLYFSVYGAVYETRAYTTADINQLVHDHGLHCLTSADRQFDFWFSPSTHPFAHRINRKATEIYLATTGFTASNVPLLRGIVILATHTAAGELAGLTEAQLDRLINALDSTSWRQDLVLSRRYARDDRQRRRSVKSANQRANASLSWPTI